MSSAGSPIQRTTSEYRCQNRVVYSAIAEAVTQWLVSLPPGADEPVSNAGAKSRSAARAVTRSKVAHGTAATVTSRSTAITATLSLGMSPPAGLSNDPYLRADTPVSRSPAGGMGSLSTGGNSSRATPEPSAINNNNDDDGSEAAKSRAHSTADMALADQSLSGDASGPQPNPRAPAGQIIVFEVTEFFLNAAVRAQRTAPTGELARTSYLATQHAELGRHDTSASVTALIAELVGGCLSASEEPMLNSPKFATWLRVSFATATPTGIDFLQRIVAELLDVASDAESPATTRSALLATAAQLVSAAGSWTRFALDHRIAAKAVAAFAVPAPAVKDIVSVLTAKSVSPTPATTTADLLFWLAMCRALFTTTSATATAVVFVDLAMARLSSTMVALLDQRSAIRGDDALNRIDPTLASRIGSGSAVAGSFSVRARHRLVALVTSSVVDKFGSRSDTLIFALRCALRAADEFIVVAGNGSGALAAHAAREGILVWVAVVADLMFNQHSTAEAVDALATLSAFVTENARETFTNVVHPAPPPRGLSALMHAMLTEAFTAKVLALAKSSREEQINRLAGEASNVAVISDNNASKATDERKSLGSDSVIQFLLQLANQVGRFRPESFASHEWCHFFLEKGSVEIPPVALRDVCALSPLIAQYVGGQAAFALLAKRLMRAGLEGRFLPASHSNPSLNRSGHSGTNLSSDDVAAAGGATSNGRSPSSPQLSPAQLTSKQVVAQLFTVIASNTSTIARADTASLISRTHVVQNAELIPAIASLAKWQPSVFGTLRIVGTATRVFDRFLADNAAVIAASTAECGAAAERSKPAGASPSSPTRSPPPPRLPLNDTSVAALPPLVEQVCVAFLDIIDTCFSVKCEITASRAPKEIFLQLMTLLDLQRCLPRNVWRAVNLVINVKENRPLFANRAFRDRFVRFGRDFDAFDPNTFVFGAILCNMIHTNDARITPLFDTDDIRRSLADMPLTHWAYFDAFRYRWKCINCNLIGHRSAGVSETATPPPRWECIKCKGHVWQPDDESDTCHDPRCSAKLERFKRHHCRSCGWNWCGAHCKTTGDPIPDLQFVPLASDNKSSPQLMCAMCVQVTTSYRLYRGYKYKVPARDGGFITTDAVGVAEYFKHGAALAWMVNNKLGLPNPERARLMGNAYGGAFSVESQQVIGGESGGGAGLSLHKSPSMRGGRGGAAGGGGGSMRKVQSFRSSDDDDDDRSDAGTSINDKNSTQFFWI